jgi:hypothetical protein
MRLLTVILIHLLAAWIPLLSKPGTIQPGTDDFVAWPSEIGGVELARIDLSEDELSYYQDFPGKVARFLAGDREVVVRYLSRPSRKLHPAADCLRGFGYRVRPQPVQRDAEGGFWGCVVAEKASSRLRVCEKIEDSTGRSWYDVSSWYWAALLGQSAEPWWAVTVAERI